MAARGDGAGGQATPHRTQSNPNVFDDEYAVSTPSSDTDANETNRLPSPTQERRVDPRASDGAEHSSRTRSSTQAMPARSSIHKPRISNGQGDDRTSVSPYLGAAVPTPLAALPQRASSTASSYAPTDRGQSPQPQLHPTYPYDLYQQSTSLGRTPSVATESTIRPPSTIASSSLPQRPTHPYALYTQNGLDEDAESVAPNQAPVQMGFSNTQSNFHRRIGPDGEEQGIIGPDGHTEQLPPYSEYPEHGAAKVAVAVAGASQGSAAASPEEMTPTSTGSQAPINQSARAAEDGNISEKHWRDKSWKERRRTKVCGGAVPCWMLSVMVGCGIVIVGLIAGLIGGLLSAENKSGNKATVTTTLYDASQIATPTGVPGPPTGSWALSLGVPEETQPYCLTDSNEYSAWTCATNGPPLKLNIKLNPPGADCPGTAQIGNIIPQGSEFNYGTQPPVMDVSNLEWVSDLDDPNSGPALHFQAYYDKQVLVDGSDLSPPSRLLRRTPSAFGDPLVANPMYQKGRVVPGDQPWLCYWNTTFIEGFIYMEKNSSDAASQSSFFAGMTATSESKTSSTVQPGYQTLGSSTPTAQWKRHQSETDNYYDSSTDYTGPAVTESTDPAYPTPYSSWVSSSSPSPSSSSAPTTSSTSSSTSTAADTPNSVYTLIASASGTSTAYTIPTVLPLFPHIIKIEERRMSMDNNDAYCTKMQLLNDQQLVPYEMPDGRALTFALSETDPSAQEVQSSDGDGDGDGTLKRRVKRYRRLRDLSVFERSIVEERGEPSDSCHCQWKNR